MSEPQRIQRKRTKGWRMPEGAVYVGRPSRWGNTYRIERCRTGPGWRVVGNGEVSWSADDNHPWTQAEAARWATEKFRDHIPMKSIRAHKAQVELGGRDLACWCPLEDDEGNRVPCHADVLLEIANSAPPVADTEANRDA